MSGDAGDSLSRFVVERAAVRGVRVRLASTAAAITRSSGASPSARETRAQVSSSAACDDGMRCSSSPATSSPDATSASLDATCSEVAR